MIVTGPGPVIIPNCKVTFKDQAGNYYTKTSDASGYIYLLRDELPDWSDGSPSISDLGLRTKPESFTFGGKTVDDASKIAATCGVPYKVDVNVEMTSSSWRDRTVYADYQIKRIVEGKEEHSWADIEFPNSDIYNGLGYFLYRSLGDLSLYKSLEFARNGTSVDMDRVVIGNHFLAFCRAYIDDYWDRPFGTEPSSQTASLTFGDGASPSLVSVHYLPVTKSYGGYEHGGFYPDYGLACESMTKTILPEYCGVGGLDVGGFKSGNGDEPYTSDNGRLVLGDDGVTKIPVSLTNYELILGQTSFSFVMDYSSFGHVYLQDSYYDDETDTFRFKRYDSFLEYITDKQCSANSEYCMSVSCSGVLGGVKVSNSTSVRFSSDKGELRNMNRSYQIRNVYDGFKLEFSDFKYKDAFYGSEEGKFSYDESNPYVASCSVGGAYYTFQTIKDGKSAM